MAIPQIDCTTTEFNKKFDQIYDGLLNGRIKFCGKMSRYTDLTLYPNVTKKNSVTLKYFRALAAHRQDVIATSNEMCAFAMTWMYFANKGKSGSRTNEMGLDFYLE